ncbi:hypothetical protein DPMN_003827 [Dreissena polymorpha]|uniref:Uncharacterized protein n=1 Tax=Dreissena polymorpha TaxID=45954 RepID=A0A9D4RVB5_DREPO|nr:hypothetical protein DPMN_003827 [Dreissena polymorpha]
MADCLKENFMLYLKSKYKYKNTIQKTDLWNSNALELNIEPGVYAEDLLREEKRGSATKNIAVRQISRKSMLKATQLEMKYMLINTYRCNLKVRKFVIKSLA